MNSIVNKKSQTTEELTLWIVRIIIVVLALISLYNFIRALINTPVYIYEVKGKYLFDRLFYTYDGISCIEKREKNNIILNYCVDSQRLKTFESRFSKLYDPNYISVFIVLITQSASGNQIKETFVFNKDHFLTFFPEALANKVDYHIHYESKYVKFRDGNVETLAKIGAIIIFPKE
ncbi:MAG: hypothetical protein QXS41_03605 [Candidatus Woesearchaeota archaeon]